MVKKTRFRRPRLNDPAPRVHPIFDDFHHLRMTVRHEYPRHRHTNYEAIIVERGPYRCELNGEELVIGAGRVLVIKPGDWHQDHLRNGQRHYVLHFRLAGVLPGKGPLPLFRDGVAPALQICRGNFARDTFFLRELRREAEGGEPYAPAVQDALLEALFWRMVRGLEAQALSDEFRRLPTAELQREKLAEIFHRHLNDNPNVRELAAEAEMSPRHFTNLCGRLLGDAPARFLLLLKLRRAEEMLRYPGQRVKEVSDMLGFANPYHFSRVYRRQYGRPPSMRHATGSSKPAESGGAG